MTTESSYRDESGSDRLESTASLDPTDYAFGSSLSAAELMQ